MDPQKASWILEFVLRQPIEDWLANEILLRLPLPPRLDPNLKKTFLVRRLSSDLSAGRLSDDTLQALELIEELDRSVGAAEPHDALKVAYCAVAAEVTAVLLRRACSPAEAEAEFYEVANGIWKCRVADMERSDARGMVGEGLREWRKEVEDAMARESASEWVRRRDTRGEAEAALREYLRVTLRDMGPPLLELVARVLGGKADAGVGDGTGWRAGERVATEAGPSGLSAEKLLPTESATPALDRSASVVSGVSGECSMPTGATMAKLVRLASATGILPLQEDLPKVNATETQNRMAEVPAKPDDFGAKRAPIDIHVAGPYIEKDARAALEGQQGAEGAQRARFGLMERNPTARTYEWDEGSNESQSEKSTDFSKRRCLPTPRTQRMSPLKLKKATNFFRTRKIKRWTPEEEDALREAVKNKLFLLGMLP